MQGQRSSQHTKVHINFGRRPHESNKRGAQVTAVYISGFRTCKVDGPRCVGAHIQLREATTRVQPAQCSGNRPRRISSLQGERFPRRRGAEQMFGRATHLPYGPELNERPSRCWVVQQPCWSVLHRPPHEIRRKNRKNTLSRTPRTPSTDSEPHEKCRSGIL